jgi:hypothetical protein
LVYPGLDLPVLSNSSAALVAPSNEAAINAVVPYFVVYPGLDLPVFINSIAKSSFLV